MAEDAPRSGGGFSSNLPGGGALGSGGIGSGALPGGALDAGQVVVSLMGKLDKSGFTDFDKAIKEAQDKGKKGQIEADLGAKVDESGFTKFKEFVKAAGELSANATLGFNVNQAGYTDAETLLDKFGNQHVEASLGFKVDRGGYTEAERLGSEFGERKDSEQLGYDVHKEGVERATEEGQAFGRRKDSETLGYDVNLTGAERAAQEGEAFGHRHDAETLGYNVERSGLDRAIELAKEFGQRRDMASLGFNVDRRGYDEAVRLADELGKKVVDIKINFDVEGIERVKAQIAELDAQLSRVREIKIKADVDQASFERARADIDTVTRSHEKLTVSQDTAGRSAKNTGSAVDSMGLSALGSAAKIGGMSAGVLLAAPALNALAGSAISVVGALGPLTGLAAGAAPAMLGLVAAGKLTTDAFQGVTKAVEGNEAAYKKLDPAQKAFVDQLRSSGIALELTNARLDSHRVILGGAMQAFQALRPHMDIFTNGMHMMSEAISQVIAGFGRMLSAADSLRGLSALTREMATTFSAMGAAATSIGHAFLIATAAAEPLVNWLSQLVRQGAAWVDTSIQAADRTGALNTFFQHTQEVATTLGHIIANLAVTLFNFFKVGRDSGQGLLETLDGLTKKWREWSASIEGQNALRKYFAEAADMTRVVLGLVGDLIGAIVRITEPTKQWRDTWADMHNIVGPLTNVLSNFITQVGPALVHVVEGIVQLLLTLQGILPTIKVVLDVVNAMVHAFLDLINTVPGLKQIVEVVGAIVLGFKALEIAFTPIKGMAKIIGEMATAWKGVQIAADIARASMAAFAAGDIAGGLSILTSRISGFSKELNNAKKAADEAGNATAGFGGKARSAANDAESLGASAAGASGKTKNLGSEAENAGSKTQGLAKDAEGAGKNLGSGGLQGVVGGLIGSLTGGGGLTASLGAVGAALAPAGILVAGAGAFADSMRQLKNTVVESISPIDNAGNSVKNTGSQFDFVSRNIGTNFIPGALKSVEGFLGIKSAAEKAEEAFKRLPPELQTLQTDLENVAKSANIEYKVSINTDQANNIRQIKELGHLAGDNLIAEFLNAKPRTSDSIKHMLDEFNNMPPEVKAQAGMAMTELANELEKGGVISHEDAEAIRKGVSTPIEQLAGESGAQARRMSGDIHIALGQTADDMIAQFARAGKLSIGEAEQMRGGIHDTLDRLEKSAPQQAADTWHNYVDEQVRNGSIPAGAAAEDMKRRVMGPVDRIKEDAPHAMGEAMVQSARTLEEQGKLPIGSADRLEQGLDEEIGKLPPDAKKRAQDAMIAMGVAILEDKHAPDAEIDRFIQDEAKKFGILPDDAYKAGGRIPPATGQGIQDNKPQSDFGMQDWQNRLKQQLGEIPPFAQPPGDQLPKLFGGALEQSIPNALTPVDHLTSGIGEKFTGMRTASASTFGGMMGDISSTMSAHQEETPTTASTIGTNIGAHFAAMRTGANQTFGGMMGDISSTMTTHQSETPTTADFIRGAVQGHFIDMHTQANTEFTGMMTDTHATMSSRQDENPTVADYIRGQVHSHFIDMHNQGNTEFAGMMTDTHNTMTQHQEENPTTADYIRRTVVGHFNDQHTQVGQAVSGMVNDLNTNYVSLQSGTSEGMARIGRNTNAALASFGAPRISLGVNESPASFSGSAPAGTVTAAQGGPIGRRGAKGPDDMLIVAGEGEYVLTSHMQPDVDQALRGMFGFGLDDLQEKHPQAHSHATGGFVGSGRGAPADLPRFQGGGPITSVPKEILHALTGPDQEPPQNYGQAGLDKNVDAANKKLQDELAKLSAGNNPVLSGELIAIVSQLAAMHGWNAADWLWIIGHESGGSPTAMNPSSGAYGIGQFLPFNYNAYGPAGPGTSVGQQLAAMANYIQSRYGNPSAAKAFWESHNWYEHGGRVTPDSSLPGFQFGGSVGFYGGVPDFEQNTPMGGGYHSWWADMLARQFDVRLPDTWFGTQTTPSEAPGGGAAILSPNQIYDFLFPVPPGSLGSMFPTGGPLPSFDIGPLGPGAPDISWLQGEIGRWNTVLQQAENQYNLMGQAIQGQGITRPQDVANQLAYRKLIAGIEQQQIQRLGALQGNLSEFIPNVATNNKEAFQFYMPLLDQTRSQILDMSTKLAGERITEKGLARSQRSMVVGDIANFNAARQQLYQQAGTNFASPFSGGGQALNVAQQIAAQTPPNFNSSVPALGLGTSGMPASGSLSGGGNYINVNNYYTGSPTDAMTWAQQQAWELRVAL